MLTRFDRNSKKGRSPTIAILFTVVFTTIFAYSYYYFESTIEAVTKNTIRSSTEASHADMVLVASHALSSEISALITEYKSVSNKIDWPSFTKSSIFNDFDKKVRSLVRNTEVLKLKIYADDSVTVYSSDPTQIGEKKSEIELVTHALRGRSSSKVEVRETFSSFDDKLNNIDLVSSYHPLINSKGETIGVVEIYSNRTAEFKEIREYSKTQIGRYLIIIALALSFWFGYVIYGSIRQRRTD